MENSEQLNELIGGLIKFQGMVESVPMNKKAKIVFEKNGKWIDKSYSYADLGAIFDAIRKPLSECGLAISQFPSVDNGEVVVQTILFHNSGQFIKESLRMKPADLKIQSIGSTITYGKRYSLSAILGISTEEDDDGEAGNADGMNQIPPAERRPLQTNGNRSRRPTSTQATQSTSQPQNQPETTNRTINEAEFNVLSKALAANQVSKDRWIEYVTDTFKVSETMQLTVPQFKQVLNTLETDPDLIRVGPLPF